MELTKKLTNETLNVARELKLPRRQLQVKAVFVFHKHWTIEPVLAEEVHVQLMALEACQNRLTAEKQNEDGSLVDFHCLFQICLFQTQI